MTVVIVCGHVEVASWPFETRTPPDLTDVDGLCRLGLAAHRCGWSIRLRDAPGDLRDLLELVGLAAWMAPAGELVVEVGGEPEGSEEIGVQEGVDPGDPAV
jgi:hypothetical protein